MKKTTLLLLALLLEVPVIFAQKEIPLRSTPAPAGVEWSTPERQYFSPIFQTEVVTNTSRPSLTVYSPNPAVANGTAVIVAPGGGFHAHSINSEGVDVAKWLVERGVTAFVLKYRLVPTGEDGVAEFAQKVADREKMERDAAPIIELAKADGLAAIEYVRTHAEEFGVKPNRIGIIGFSAGGAVAGSAAFDYTAASRPDFVAPIYPAMQVVNTATVPANAPPLFIAVARDDVFGFQKLSTALFDQWNAAGKSAELHVYDEGGHGFGMRKQNLPSDHWIERFGEWLDARGWLKNYRDLNHNGQKDPYEDSALPIEKRIDNLLAQMTLEEKAGQMFITGVPVNRDGSLDFNPALVSGFAAFRPAAKDHVAKLNLSHFNLWQIPDDPAVLAKWNNKLQKFAEKTRLQPLQKQYFRDVGQRFFPMAGNTRLCGHWR